MKHLVYIVSFALLFSQHAQATTLGVTPGAGANIQGKSDGSGNFAPTHTIGDATNPDNAAPVDATKGLGVNELDCSDVTQGCKADAKSTATDTTPITIMSVLKQVSASVQAAAASLATAVTSLGSIVTNTTGASTAANQTTANTSLATIATNSAAPVPAQSNTTSVVNIGNVGQTNGDPCSTQAHVYTPVNLATAATTVLVSGVSAKKKYICGVMLKNNAANNVALFSGSGSACGTSPHSVMGGQTTGAGFILAANDGFVAGTGTNAVAATTTNADDLCIALSASSQVSGYIVTTDQ